MILAWIASLWVCSCQSWIRLNLMCALKCLQYHVNYLSSSLSAERGAPWYLTGDALRDLAETLVWITDTYWWFSRFIWLHPLPVQMPLFALRLCGIQTMVTSHFQFPTRPKSNCSLLDICWIEARDLKSWDTKKPFIEGIWYSSSMIVLPIYPLSNTVLVHIQNYLFNIVWEPQNVTNLHYDNLV